MTAVKPLSLWGIFLATSVAQHACTDCETKINLFIYLFIQLIYICKPGRIFDNVTAKVTNIKTKGATIQLLFSLLLLSSSSLILFLLSFSSASVIFELIWRKSLPFGHLSLKWLQISLGSFFKNWSARYNDKDLLLRLKCLILPAECLPRLFCSKFCK